MSTAFRASAFARLRFAPSSACSVRCWRQPTIGASPRRWRRDLLLDPLVARPRRQNLGAGEGEHGDRRRDGDIDQGDVDPPTPITETPQAPGPLPGLAAAQRGDARKRKKRRAADTLGAMIARDV